MQKNESLAISAGGLIVALAGIGAGIFFYSQRVDLNKQIDAYKESTTSMKKEIASVEKSQNEILLQQNNNPSNTAEANDTAKTRDYVDSFAKQLYHIDYHMSSSEVEARASNLRRYTDEKTLAVTGLYGTVVDQQIARKTEISKVKVESFVKPTVNSQVSGLVNVSYSITSLVQTKTEKHTMCYSFTFDLNTKKFTKFARVAQLK